jgi:hypothetical protein
MTNPAADAPPWSSERCKNGSWYLVRNYAETGEEKYRIGEGADLQNPKRIEDFCIDAEISLNACADVDPVHLESGCAAKWKKKADSPLGGRDAHMLLAVSHYHLASVVKALSRGESVDRDVVDSIKAHADELDSFLSRLAPLVVESDVVYGSLNPRGAGDDGQRRTACRESPA